MKKFRMLLVGLLVALALTVPLVFVAVNGTDARPPVMRIADQPTPTPTPPGGSPCQGQGC